MQAAAVRFWGSPIARAGSVLVVLAGLIAGGCGWREERVGSSLPPLTVATSTTTTMPTTSTAVRYYEVQRGDSLSNIAQTFGVSLQELAALNGITNLDSIQAGQQLKLPPSTVVVTAPTDTAPADTAPPSSS